MANVARLSVGIWSDATFTALGADEQWLFLLLLSQNNLGRDGTIALTANRWAGYARDASRERVIDALRNLAVAGFVRLDETAEEVQVLRYFLPQWRVGDRSRTRKVRRPTIPAHVRRAVYARDSGACVRCGATDDLALDHIHPFSKGGPDTVANLQVLCRSCNSKKGARV